MKKNSTIVFITGFLMAVADSVPGVSGGTICYITGCYDMFINSIDTILKFKNSSDKKSSLMFMFKLGTGWIIGFIGAVLVVSSLIESNIYELSSLFLGFIVFSIPYIILEEKSVIKDHKKHIIYTLFGASLVIAITMFSANNINVWSDNINIQTYAFIFLAGIIAISSMIIPGISGSTILLIFGLYIPIIGAIKDLLGFDFSSLDIVLVFAAGILVGIKFTTSIISKALKYYRSQSIYLIIGLMLGSIYSIIIGPTTLTSESSGLSLNLDPLTFKTFSIPVFILGVFVIYIIDFTRKKADK